MPRWLHFRRALGAVLFLSLLVACFQAGCGDGGDGSTFTPGGDQPDATIGPPPPDFGNTDAGNGDNGDADPDAALGVLDVTPATVTINVVIANGMMNAPPQQFTAKYNGQQVPATWLFDRGELGDIDANGVFKANGSLVGEGTITARYGAREGTAKVKIILTQTQNGAPTYAGGQPDGGAGFGGLGGVGGEPLGPPVDPAVAAKLRGTPTAPANAQELGFLYPYEATVWPRGLLPPLLMWQSTYNDASAVYVKVSQSNYTFEGTYSLAALGTGDPRKRVRIQDDVWKTATQGNLGDDLKVEVRIHTAAGTVIGPITRTWKVAPGVLKGTVYYNSYDSELTAGTGAETGGVIAIQPRSPEPTLAIPSQAGKCHVCHVVSADGSTLWAQDGKNGGNDDYRRGASYDLKNPAAARTLYDGVATPAQNRKFVWSGPYPDGSFALASSGYTREAYTQGPSKLFNRAAGAEVVSTGLATVTNAVTPAFSPDGRKVAFNFWAGSKTNGVDPGAGRSLAVFDFTCGAAAGSVTCAAGTTPAFSNLREIYKDPSRWPGWPSFLPDGKAVVFHNTVKGGDVGGNGSECRADIVQPPPNINNCQLTTWFGATSELWIAQDSATKNARRLDAANGLDAAGIISIPTSGTHPKDSELNYNPSVNPVASGGYYWVVFTSRRLYGNLLTQGRDAGPQKKLWVAAIDITTGAVDPSHPAFYLPGQEIGAGNTRGFWVVDPCKANGSSCETGDECCNGFCRKAGDGGALVCQDKPPGTVCVQEFEKCTVDADCCDPKFKCIANKCSRPDPIIK
jgi:hypothetical protein